MSITDAMATARALHRDRACTTITLHDLTDACAAAHHTPHDASRPEFAETAPAALFVFHVGQLRGAANALRTAADQPHLRWWQRRRAHSLAAALSWHAFTHSDTYPSLEKIPASTDWHRNGWHTGQAAVTRALEPLASHLTPAPTTVVTERT